MSKKHKIPSYFWGTVTKEKIPASVTTVKDAEIDAAVAGSNNGDGVVVEAETVVATAETAETANTTEQATVIDTSATGQGAVQLFNELIGLTRSEVTKLLEDLSFHWVSIRRVLKVATWYEERLSANSRTFVVPVLLEELLYPMDEILTKGRDEYGC